MMSGQPGAGAGAVVERAPEGDEAGEPGSFGRLARTLLALEQLGSQIHRRSIAEGTTLMCS